MSNRAKLTHCRRGHALTEDNTYLNVKNKATGRVGRQCKQCIAMKKVNLAWHKDYYSKLDKNKVKARGAVAQAINSKTITRPDNCSQCEKKCRPDAHHEDYARPLDVVWLCRYCHRRIHGLGITVNNQLKESEAYNG